LAETPLSTARIYDSIYVRHWDYYLSVRFNAVFSGVLKRGYRYSLDGALKNLVSDVKNLESPYPPYAVTDRLCDFAGRQVDGLQEQGASNCLAPTTRRPIFTLSHTMLEETGRHQRPGQPRDSERRGGRLERAILLSDSKKIAYFSDRSNTYESGRRGLYIYTIGSKETIARLAHNWDRSPDTAKWTADGKTLIISSEDSARVRLFTIPLNADDDYKLKTSPTAA